MARECLDQHLSRAFCAPDPGSTTDGGQVAKQHKEMWESGPCLQVYNFFLSSNHPFLQIQQCLGEVQTA